MMKLAYAICIALGLGVGVTHAAGTDCQATSSKMLDHLDKHDYLGATANFNERDPECDLDYIPNQPRALRVEAALSNSFAFGGLNAVVAFRAAPR